MHDETDARGRRDHVPLLHRRWLRGTWQLTAVAALQSLSSLGCQAGELDERQEQYLRRQLDKHYPNGGQVSDDTSGSEPTTPAGTSAEETSAPPSATSESDVTSAPGTSAGPVTSEPDPTSAGSTGDTGAAQIPECAIQTFQTSCSGDVCHYGGAIQLNPNFATGGDLFTLLTTTMTGCDGAPSQLYVDLANPQDSYLLVKVRGEQPTGCGNAMPTDRSAISQAQIDCLEDWIGSL